MHNLYPQYFFDLFRHIQPMIDRIFHQWLQNEFRDLTTSHCIIINFLHPETIIVHNQLDFQVCTDILHLAYYCRHCLPPVQTGPIIGRQCQCHLTDLLFICFDCLPVDN